MEGDELVPVHDVVVVVVPPIPVLLRGFHALWLLVGHELSQGDLHPGLELDRVDGVGNLPAHGVHGVIALVGKFAVPESQKRNNTRF